MRSPTAPARSNARRLSLTEQRPCSGIDICEFDIDMARLNAAAPALELARAVICTAAGDARQARPSFRPARAGAPALA